jgi:two-component system OmpR family sensor kinase
VLFITINAMIYFNYYLSNKELLSFRVKRYFKVIQEINQLTNQKISKENIYKKIRKYEMIPSDTAYDYIATHGKLNFQERFIKIYSYKGFRYIYLKKPTFILMKRRLKDEFKISIDKNNSIANSQSHVFFLKDISSSQNLSKDIALYGILLALIIDSLLIWFYFYLYQKFRPLKKLKKEIIKFSKGNFNINTTLHGNDEIAQVSNEFNKAILKIKELSDSRNLFLRNIMHELKTPITKGKLVTDILMESRRTEILKKVFHRLEYLLGEFAKIEELTSGKLVLRKHEYRVADIVDQAMDILLLEAERIVLEDTHHSLVVVDFELFSIALKNLIENALKYGDKTPPLLKIKDNSLSISNKGSALTKPLKEYLKPFNREYESIDKGLGLGLYISNSIIEHHGFKLDYCYSKGEHIFTIYF